MVLLSSQCINCASESSGVCARITGGVTGMPTFLNLFFPSVAEAQNSANRQAHSAYCTFDDAKLQLWTSSMFLAGAFICEPTALSVRFCPFSLSGVANISTEPCDCCQVAGQERLEAGQIWPVRAALDCASAAFCRLIYVVLPAQLNVSMIFQIVQIHCQHLAVGVSAGSMHAPCSLVAMRQNSG